MMNVLLKGSLPLLILTLVTSLLIFKACSSFGDPQKLKMLVQSGAKLIDVRTPREYAEGHLDGALNIPVDQIEQRLNELGDPSQPLVVYCRSGARSGRAQKLLQSKGFHQVHNLGGIGRWPQ